MIKKLYLYNLDIKYIKLFNRIYKTEKKTYIDYLSKIFKYQSNFGIISPFFGRLNGFNSVYPLICKTKLIQIILKKKKNCQYHIWTNSYVEYLHLKKNFKNEKIFIKTGVIKKIFLSIKPYVTIIYRLFFLVYFSLFEILNKSPKRKNLIIKSNNIILLDTTLMRATFNNKKNIFLDRFYGDMFKKKVKGSNFFIAPENLLFKDTKKYLNKIKNEKNNFIFRFDFLNIMDYIKALKIVGLENLNFNKKFYRYQSIKLDYSIFIDKMNSKFNLNFYVGVLNYFFFKRLSDNKVQLKNIINWNENQPADKGFVLGSKKFFPKIPIKGFACYFVNYDYYFDKQPLKCEFKKNLIPDELFVPTKLNKIKIKKFCKDINVYEAPLFRFKSLLKITKIKKNKSKNSISVFLPIERIEAINIIIQLSKSNFILSNNVEVIVKPHPDMSNQFINELLQICQNRFIFSNQALYIMMQKTNLVISTSSSSTIEAIFYGKPVISPINTNLLVDTPIANIIPKKYYKISYTSEDLNKKISKYLLMKKNHNFDFIKNKQFFFSKNEKKKYLKLIS